MLLIVTSVLLCFLLLDVFLDYLCCLGEYVIVYFLLLLVYYLSWVFFRLLVELLIFMLVLGDFLYWFCWLFISCRYYICFVLSDGLFFYNSLIVFLSVVTFFYSGINLFNMNLGNWSVFLVSVSLSSSCLMLYFGFFGSSVSFLLYILFGWMYMFLIVFFFFRFSNVVFNVFGGYNASLFLFILIPFPWAYSLFYKVWGVYSFMVGGFSIFFFCWCIYSMIEQIYLYIMLVGEEFFVFSLECGSSRLVNKVVYYNIFILHVNEGVYFSIVNQCSLSFSTLILRINSGYSYFVVLLQYISSLFWM
uniref:NADH dehydrogenase subunit 2 n=1 Tax=Diplorchis hangzhouensis TaxID=1131906 RepID=A0A3G0WMI5_9PLAT|nr:NADH dehydrogenase subunit 2 [Diplorchis hangzhouensis]